MSMEKSYLNKTNSPCINVLLYGGGYSVCRRHIIDKVEDIFSSDVSHHPDFCH